MREEDQPTTNPINQRINEILDCGFRYAKYKMCLRKNKKKRDSRYLSYQYLLERLKEEVIELEQAIINALGESRKLEFPDGNSCSQNIEKIAQEAGDIINFASMICDKTEQI